MAIITKSTGIINAQTGFNIPAIKKSTPSPNIAIPAIISAPMPSINLNLYWIIKTIRLYKKNNTIIDIMRLACLFSGGKDSTFSIYKSLMHGHEVPCLISIHPYSDESLLYHFPNNIIFKKISEAIEIPIIEKYCNNIKKEHELEKLLVSSKTSN